MQPSSVPASVGAIPQSFTGNFVKQTGVTKIRFEVYINATGMIYENTGACLTPELRPLGRYAEAFASSRKSLARPPSFSSIMAAGTKLHPIKRFVAQPEKSLTVHIRREPPKPVSADRKSRHNRRFFTVPFG